MLKNNYNFGIVKLHIKNIQRTKNKPYVLFDYKKKDHKNNCGLLNLGCPIA